MWTYVSLAWARPSQHCPSLSPKFTLMVTLLQEYNYHLGAVNSVTFVDGGQRFVTTSDDKSIRMWELGIPVQV